MIVVAGHICLDLIPRLGGPLPLPGGLLPAGAMAMSTGGAVANVGVALWRLGSAVRLVGRVGDDLLGGCVRGVLGQWDARLADGLVTAAGGEPTSYSVVLSVPGEDRRFLHCPGVNDTFTAGDVQDSHLAGGRLLHFGYPTLMAAMYADGARELTALLRRAKAAGLRTSVDLSMPSADAMAQDWRKILGAALPYCDLFTPSLDETRMLLRTDADAPAIAAELLAMGAGAVMLKLGDEGAYLRTADGFEGRERCFVADVVGTTGSGDATIAGMLAALDRGLDWSAALRMATAVGACSVEALDATSGIPRWETVVARVSAGWGKR